MSFGRIEGKVLTSKNIFHNAWTSAAFGISGDVSAVFSFWDMSNFSGPVSDCIWQAQSSVLLYCYVHWNWKGSFSSFYKDLVRWLCLLSNVLTQKIMTVWFSLCRIWCLIASDCSALTEKTSWPRIWLIPWNIFFKCPFIFSKPKHEYTQRGPHIQTKLDRCKR